jgi:hypothetical protein
MEQFDDDPGHPKSSDNIWTMNYPAGVRRLRGDRYTDNNPTVLASMEVQGEE